MKSKPILCAQRLRHVPRQFSWIDQRLVRDGHIRGRTTEALALYLFLCTVADAQGTSYYSEGRVCEFLGLECAGLRAARRELIDAGLVAYSRPFYQVLSLDPHKMESSAGILPERALQGQRGGEAQSMAEILAAMMEGQS